jgi:hypothetical protein
MGIARRKAGTVVSCPTCHGQVVVPDPGPGNDEPEKPENGADAPPLFDASDFDEIFADAPGVAAPPQPPAPPAPATAPAPAPPAAQGASPPAGWGAKSEEINFEVERVPLPSGSAPGPGTAGRPGIWLSPTALVLIILLIIILLGVAFVGGLLLGHSLAG